MTTAVKRVLITHWNVNEMRTTELVDDENERINLICKTILENTGGRIPDFALFNEIEFDMKDVPTEEYQTVGGNLSTLFGRLVASTENMKEPPPFDTKKTFHPGNCGIDGRATKMEDGNYFNTRNAPEEEKMKYGDLLNCLATLPGQYGVGFWTKYKIVDLTIISKLTWKQFNPAIDLTQFKDLKGGEIPDDITLFDKCCMVVKVDIDGTPVNFVVVHTVPAYDFGNKESPALARNNDQLAFLEWLLTGKTYLKVPDELKDDNGKLLAPINPEEGVFCMGDLNCDFRADKPGSQRLNYIMGTHGIHTFPKGETTEIGTQSDGKKIEMQLDYMFSRNLSIVEGSEKIGPIEPDHLSDHGLLVSEIEVGNDIKTDGGGSCLVQ